MHHEKVWILLTIGICVMGIGDGFHEQAPLPYTRPYKPFYYLNGGKVTHPAEDYEIVAVSLNDKSNVLSGGSGEGRSIDSREGRSIDSRRHPYGRNRYASNRFKNRQDNFFGDYSDYSDYSDSSDNSDYSDIQQGGILKVEKPPSSSEWIQLSVMGLTAFGFAILGAQLTAGFTNPPNFGGFIPWYRSMFPPGLAGGETGRDYASLVHDVVKRIDAVDLTFGVMEVDGQRCREKAICELRRTFGLMSSVEWIFTSYLGKIPGMEKYREAVELGAAGKDCGSRYPSCLTEAAEFLPRFLRF